MSKICSSDQRPMHTHTCNVPSTRLLCPAAIARLAVRAAVHEASITLKPGLVCPDTQGAHRDMDIATMFAGALSLENYFKDTAACGMRDADQVPSAVFPTLRHLGMEAESSMLAATGGINTHKGLIFSLGILAAATGRNSSLNLGLDCASVCRTGASLVRGITERDFGPFLDIRSSDCSQKALLRKGESLAARPLTAGEKFFLTFGITGIRGEAERGFPHVIAAREKLDCLLRQGQTFNTAAVNVLLQLMRDMTDTNVLHRAGMQGLEWVRCEAAEILLAGGACTTRGRHLLQLMGRQCVAKNISPGGCADILAVVFYFHFLNEYLTI